MRYRYDLWRIWDVGKGFVNFVCLNPSTATAEVDDPTVRKCTTFATTWGYGGMVMTNIFAFRATDPKVMKAEEDPIGTDNDGHLVQRATTASLVVTAWGTHGAHLNRGRQVYEMLVNRNIAPYCFRVTKEGQPYHPLYERSTALLMQYHIWSH